jgi:hypothetical protein
LYMSIASRDIPDPIVLLVFTTYWAVGACVVAAVLLMARAARRKLG